jgi:ATP-dependent Clp protease protease subunit
VTGPLGRPLGTGADPVADVQSRLFERRIVLLSGELDDNRAGQVAAQLMTLDATGDDHVTLQVNSWGESLQAAFAVMDTIDLLGVPVHSVCVGRAEGPVVGIVAIAANRRAAPHARFRLSQPRFETSGTALELAEWSLHCQRQLDRYCERLAEATHQPSTRIAADLESGRFLSAADAVRYGLIDEVGRPEPADHRDRPFGFRP